MKIYLKCQISNNLMQIFSGGMDFLNAQYLLRKQVKPGFTNYQPRFFQFFIRKKLIMCLILSGAQNCNKVYIPKCQNLTKGTWTQNLAPGTHYLICDCWYPGKSIHTHKHVVGLCKKITIF